MAQTLGIEPIAGAGGPSGGQRFGMRRAVGGLEQVLTADAEIGKSVVVHLDQVVEHHPPGAIGPHFGEPGDNGPNRVV